MIKLTWQGKAEAIEILSKRDGYHCFICNGEFGKKEKPTIDHWIPLSKGGSWDIENLRLAHKQCNLWKGDRVPLADGTIPERIQKTKVTKKITKLGRPKVCSTCMSGRILLAHETCPTCKSGPQPPSFPGWAKRKSNECDHKTYHCFACVLGFAKRSA